MNHQGLLWNVQYVVAIVVRKQIHFQSAVMRSKRSCCFSFVSEQTQTSTWPTSNHATYDVYSPKAVKTLMDLKFYEHSTLYLIQNILPFCVIEALD